MARNRVLGGSLSQARISSSLTTNHGVDVYNVDATLGTPVTLTLDPNPADGDQVMVVDVGGNASAQPITVHTSEDAPFVGGGTSTAITVSGNGLQLTYSVERGGWSSGTMPGIPLPGSVPNPAQGLFTYSGSSVTVPVLVKYSAPDTVAPAQADSMAHAAIAIVLLSEQVNYVPEYPAAVVNITAVPSAVVFSYTAPGPLTPGTTYYLDPVTPGAITATRPTTTGQIVQTVGEALDTQVLLFRLGVPIQL